MKRRIDGMVVVITGASAGIGKALAEALSPRGAKLVLAARRAERLQSLNESLGGKHLCVTADVSKSEDCRQLIATAAAHFGRIDTLVCNAGYAKARKISEMDDRDCRRLFDTNLFGTLDCIRAAVPIIRRQEIRDGRRGQIMIVSSAAARRGVPYLGLYCATKASQLSIAEALRVELKSDAIAVTSVHPVVTKTDFFTTADQVSGLKIAALANGQTQSVQVVAGHIVRSIERPRRELWPAFMSKMSLNIAVALPGLVDWFMARMQRNLLHENDREATVEMSANEAAMPSEGNGVTG